MNKTHHHTTQIGLKIKDTPHYPKFEEAAKDFTSDEIYKLAKAAYLLQVSRAGGVIE